MHTVCKLPQELVTHQFETHICMYSVLAHCKINLFSLIYYYKIVNADCFH